ncbi:replication protein A [Vibrio variabilis]|uniref:Replication protein A n=1 Tax=Vibrio variabilis TaxID=990271 RepID=A0ABQ0JIH6_9VIBR|nr:replication protein A [Vibrio variabilis]
MTHSRNCALFDHCRYFAYSIVEHERHSGSYQNFKRRLSEFVGVKNIESNDRPLLRYSEVKSIVNSVSRWTWDKYQGKANIQRGVMALSKDLPIHQRQQLAAKRTHRIRKQKTEQQILNTCRLLQRKGGVFTISVIAQSAGLCRHTVYKYFNVVESFLRSLKLVSIVELAGLFRPKVSGDYAVHQITGALNDRLEWRGRYSLNEVVSQSLVLSVKIDPISILRSES